MFISRSLLRRQPKLHNDIFIFDEICFKYIVETEKYFWLDTSVAIVRAKSKVRLHRVHAQHNELGKRSFRKKKFYF